MLENLLDTKSKKKLLSILLASPKRSFTAQELAKSAEISVRAASLAIRELSRADAVASAARTRKRLFRINPRFALYQELSDLIAGDTKKDKDEDLVSRSLKKIPNAKLVIMSGVFTFQPHLPTDLLVVGDSVSRIRLSRTLSELEKLTGLAINYTVMPVAEYQYRQMMNDRFVRDVLDYPHLFAVNSLKHKRR